MPKPTSFTSMIQKNSSSLDNTAVVISSCMVCKKPARPNSIFCSDDCIRKHAEATTNNMAASQVTELATQSLATIVSPVTNEQDRSKTGIIQSMGPQTQNQQPQSQKQTKLTSSTKTAMEQAAIITANRNNRVDVYEPKTGRCLTGNTAPSIENLKRWLQEHPTFEIVHPGSAQALAIKAKKLQLKELTKKMEQEEHNKLFSVGDQSAAQKIQTTLKVGPSKRIVLVNPQKQSTVSPQTPKAISKLAKIPQQVSLKSGTPMKSVPKAGSAAKTSVSTAATKSSPTGKITTNNTTKPTVQSQVNRKKSVGDLQRSAAPSVSTPLNKAQTGRGGTEPVRVNVQRTLKEQITLRMAEQNNINHPKLSAEEIDKFVMDTEREIYHLFSKDTGTKYRAKYRSLIFNIKDRKNESLFRKICEKNIEPKQLVRMSPEELASQELALWRENENKHQLEMIKKSELDLLACAKSYVLKTHKGEEVIESKTSDRVTLDPSISVEDVVSVLNNSTVSSTSEQLSESLLSPVPVKDTRIDSRFEKYLSVDSSSSGATAASKTSTTVLAIKAKKPAKRSRSRSRERQSVDVKRSSTKYKRKRSRDHRSRSHEKEKPRDDKIRDDRSTKGRAIIDKNKKDEKRDKDKAITKPITKTIESLAKKSVTDKSKEPPRPTKTEENYNLIDKILEAQSTIDRILRPEESNKKDDIKVQTIPEPAAVQKSISSESDQEPTSTVTIPTPPESLYQQKSDPDTGGADDDDLLWSGSIIMVDVATFQISIRPLSGDCSKINKELPSELDVVGRICPDTVWDYISKIKKSFNKEILVFRFDAAGDDDKEAYYTLYKYLSVRHRFGVIKTKSSIIKDFYILPLAAHKSLPTILSPLDKPNFDTDRPDLLLGIIVKNTTMPLKRSATVLTTSSAKVSYPCRAR